jgi:iron complex outermembrane recepter protein
MRALRSNQRLLIRFLLGLSGSTSIAALLAPSTALGEAAIELPEIRVIAPTPVPATTRRRPPVRTAPARAPATSPAPAAPPPELRDPSLIDRDKIPSATETLTREDFDPAKAASVPEALLRRVPSVFINDLAVNPFQPEIQYRGFLASPTVGAPQGVAVYQNGVRINEAFGDTVNWDFIPERAINRLDVHPSNPVFGLNALGGAISIEMKNGFNYTGREIEAIVGSFGRRGVGAQAGQQFGNWATYIAADAVHDDGWRREGASELRRIYADIGIRGDDSEFHINFTGASNRFGAAAATPIELLKRDWGAVLTTPQTYRNKLAFLNATGAVQLSDTWSVKGNAYIRSFRQKHDDGNITEVEPCENFPGEEFLCFGEDESQSPLLAPGGFVSAGILNGAPPGSIDRTATVANSYGGTVQATNADKVFGLNNHFVVGSSIDHGRVRFNSSSELGTIGNDFFVTGTGVIIRPEDQSVAPVDLKTRNTYYGFYVTDTIDITSALSVTAGGRFNLAQITLEDQLGTDLNGSHRFARFNPVVGATYKLTPNLTLYGGYSEANRAPTPAELACSNPERPCLLDISLVEDPPLKQVVAQTFEAGIRGSVPLGARNGRIDWSFGAFTTDSKDDIINVASEIIGRSFFQNAGTTRRRGIEASATYRSERWNVFATYSFVDATFRDTLTLVSENNPFANDDGEITVMPGDRLPLVPRHRFKVGAEYAVFDNWKIGGDVIVASGQFFLGDEANLNPQLPGYWVANLHTTYQVSKHVELFGKIRNLFDRRYYTAGTFFDPDEVPFVSLTDPRTVSPAAPRAFYAGVRGKF